jgi:6-phosphogluconate dehydrogenase
MTADLGVIGLAVMGQNLVLNLNDRGHCVAVWDHHEALTHSFLQTAARDRPALLPAFDLQAFIASIARPRRIILMVKAGEVVDLVINRLLPLLEAGDILIDGGNSHYADSERRNAELAAKGILFIGSGVSGGEVGARFGPSIMPGGNPAAWPAVKDLLRSIAARTESGDVCCDWVGEGGAGHYVKMVHNGIEYGDMQLIAEAWHLLKTHLGLRPEEGARVFAEWNQGPLQSYLVEITAQVLAYRDEDGEPLVEKILDSTGQKGTGKWTVIEGLSRGVPISLISEAVFARHLSTLKNERLKAASILAWPTQPFVGDRAAFIRDLAHALLAAKIISYAQGFSLIRTASEENGWHINLGRIAMLWRGGCIIRSAFLGRIKAAYETDPQLENLMLDTYFASLLRDSTAAWRRVVTASVSAGIPLPGMSAALAYFDSYRSAVLPANLLQGLRDYFGAHTYERLDQPGKVFHTDWADTGGQVRSGSYNA